jgi:hypothetical protein
MEPQCICFLSGSSINIGFRSTVEQRTECRHVIDIRYMLWPYKHNG